ncbi:hypothetical protein CANINC_004945 [Pichia inconspicua]|uniref:malate dehydrogenase n=1 Tax=Pichia inconspicua TaxID=52247 RepID=A0A4T0WVT4_9ASCO|nr:hypothetical protein CANINC_004945 [[Candida] inconspicua]
MVKVSVLGAAGGIGQPLSLLLRLNPLITELSLYDIANAAGVAADLSHIPTTQIVTAYTPKSRTDTTTLVTALLGSDIVLIPAGVPRKPGMTRDDLFKINAGIVKSLVHAAGIACPDAFICVISNPVNATVPIAVEELKKLGVFNPRKVFGVTTLDTLRLEQFLAGVIGNVKPDELRGSVYAIGGHSGDSIVPIIDKWAKSLPNDVYDALVYRVRFGGDEVVKAKDGKGSATLSMATAANRFVESIVTAIVANKEVTEIAFVKIDELPATADKIPAIVRNKTQYFSVPITLSSNGVENIQFPDHISPAEVDMVAIAAAKVATDVEKGYKFVHNSKL